MDAEKANGVNCVNGLNGVHHAAKAPFKVIIIGAGMRKPLIHVVYVELQAN